MSHSVPTQLLAVASVWAFCAVAVPLTAFADTADDREVYEPTTEQLELNERGVEALVHQEHARAVALLTEAYRLGEVNILALNLGRAYHALGQCDRAREKLERVADLPVIENPPPERIEAAAEDYLRDVDATCEQDSEADVDESDIDDTSIDDGDDDGEEADNADHIDLRYDEGFDFEAHQKTIGLGSAGAGAAVAAAGLGMHLVARTQRSDAQSRIHDGSSSSGLNDTITQAEVTSIEARANRLDTAGLITGIVGVSAAAVGTYLWATAPDSTQTASIDIGADSRSFHLGWTTRF